MEFVEDERYLQIAEAYALDAVEYANVRMQMKLNWTDRSIFALESILNVFHRDLANSRPSEEAITQFSKMWGSYLGEVFRKNHGARWGLITHDGATFPGLQRSGGGLFWPWGRVENRLRNGSEDDVWVYYQHLLKTNMNS